MKRKKTNTLKMLWLVICLLTGLLASAFSVQARTSQSRTFTVKESTAVSALSSSTCLTNAKVANTGKYYSALTGNARKIYKKLQAVNWKKKKSVTISLTKISIEDFSAAENELYKAFLKGYWSYLRDHPEVYWINECNFSYRYDDAYITEITIEPVLYYDEILSDDSAVNKALNTACKKIKKIRKKKTTTSTLKAIHNYLADLITYGNEYETIAVEHTITGSLLSKYNHSGVCEAYAKLFKILCDRFSIPCMFVKSEIHSFNYVRLDNKKWYLVDVTWDDTDITGSYDYTRFLAGKWVLTEDEDHNVTNRYTTTSNGIVTAEVSLKIPSLNKSDYKLKYR